MMHERIKEWINNHGVKRKELCEVGDVSASTLSSFLQGKSIISARILEKWAKKWPNLVCHALDLPCKNQSDEERIRLIVREELQKLK
ncbi:helix-turn-helix domain-containing protein [Thiomicrorhabdus chilensis]|uniref:helix-turn-helix domain-containing protein n=1 Tax=Thiomicrorhabdus chilensis TaxID=63656 RepID=UPI00048EF1DC|nr:helix-turn-helix transcriptional regulator [Thiomicrorhabdus chilensis]